MTFKTFSRAGAAMLLVLVAAFAAACGSSKSDSSATANATDRAFVTQMIPHHQMAVQMAKTAQQRGQHPQIGQLADSIVATQNQEITKLTAVAKQIGVKPAAMPMSGSMNNMQGDAMASDAKALGLSMDQMGMSMNMTALNTANPFDRAFIDDMVPHHQGAIRMARAELAQGSNAQLKTLAKDIVTAQTKEITDMNSWRSGWYGEVSPAGGVPAA